jgi:hypothetical protein
VYIPFNYFRLILSVKKIQGLAQDVVVCQQSDQQQHKTNDVLTVVVVVLLQETRDDQCVL